ncbi:transglycosylase SLT domain-containing protein [Aliarcobacter cryaerophilus]|uniref:transglycosylase SLT domain-containing protein n=1 Tax=Aliarcobacter cryaerophilus TaxID=28198 RepID=UPI003DA3A201
MKFKSLLLILLFISNVFASNVDIKNLTPEQLETLKEIKKHGQDTGLSYTLMAIAIKESKLGEYMVNLDTKDFGLYQANIKTVLSRQNIKDTTWNRNVFASKLVSDFQFATKNAIEELTFWQKIHRNDWTKVWGSYNAGYKFNSQQAKEYSKEIALIIKELKKFNV